MMPPQRKYQQRKSRTCKQQVTHTSISLKKGSIKLHETGNAWRPGILANVKESAEEEVKTQELYKKVRGVLNKLTPEKFDKLVFQVQELAIDTIERLEGVINLVYDKAVDEPNFSGTYAKMCNELRSREVQGQDGKALSFWEILVNRCQREFQKNNDAEINKEAKLREIQAETDPKKKSELKFAHEQGKRRIRKNSVGNVRFIGELFNLGMMTATIMHRCVKALLSKEDEESFECLCTLLKTIGKKLECESNQPDLSHYFNQMKGLTDKKGKGMNVSPRVRFLLQDVIDLRNKNWMPRSDDSTPGVGGKSVASIDKRRRKGGQEMDMDGWRTACSTSTCTTRTGKLKNSTQGESAQIMSPNMFSRCGGGRSISVKETTEEGNKLLQFYEKVRLFLHKDIPKNFDELLSRVQDIANLAFGEAADKPNFSVVYAEKCDKLRSKIAQGQDKMALLFQKFLINHCQGEIEMMMTQGVHKEAKLKEIQAETDLEKKEKLQLAFDKEERRIRVKFVSNVRFIGELFNLGILTAPVMHRCVQGLLNKEDDVSLECVCILLTAVQMKLERETIQPGLTPYFTQMKDLADEKRKGKKVSSDVRCMLQHVIDVRNNNSVPRCDGSNPMTMEQIQKEAMRETIVTPFGSRSQPNVAQKHDSMGRGGIGNPRGRGRGRGGQRIAGQYHFRGGRNH